MNNAAKTEQKKWTYWRLTNRMRAAGWQNVGRGIYTHPDCPGFNLQLFAFDTVNRCEMWHRYAEACEVPRPEDFR